MGVFGVFFGRRRVVGFNGCCSWASNGDGGLTLACVSACRGGTGFICPLPERWAGLLRGRRPAQLMVLLVDPRVFRVPEGPAARERVSVRLCTGTDLQVCGEPVGVGHG